MLKFLRMPRHWLLGVGAAALCQAAVAQRPQGLSRAYLNALTAESAVEFTLATPGPVQLTLPDLVGRPVPAAGRVGRQTMSLLPAGPARPAAGLCLVELRTAGARWTKKVVIP